jgi:hypothetical protein
VSWEFTMLFVHVAALCGLVMLYRSPPCWMQKLVVVLFLLAMTVFAAGQLAQISGFLWEGRQVLRIAFAIEHVGVLLWVFRLIYQDRVAWTSSQRSRSSSR